MLSKRIVVSARRKPGDARARAIADETALVCSRLLTSAHAAVLGGGGRLGFVAPLDSESSLAVATNVALELARQDRRVALVETDLRQPRLAEAFGERGTPGFAELIGGDAGAAARPRWRSMPQLEVVPAGESAGPVGLHERRLEEALAAIAGSIDTTILALPRLLEAPDTLLLLQKVDAVVLVVPAGRTREGDLQRAAALLSQLGVPIAGTTLTDVEHVMPLFLAPRR